jgi:hypothetical protein
MPDNSPEETAADQVGDAAPVPKKADPISLAEFLMKVGPSQWREVTDLSFAATGETIRRICRPDLTLPCSDPACDGNRTFRPYEDASFFRNPTLNTFINYRCSNCGRQYKRFAVQAVHGQDGANGRVYKYGESPAFGPPTPARLLRLFGSEKDLFLKGRRCEIQGLGVGAFVYYRRVVESHKKQIFDEIIRVSETVGLPKEQADTIRAARDENQFSKSLEAVKDALPQTLLIRGQNPLSLLHAALSGHLHEKSDQECLALAQAVRIVLIELAEKMSAALSDQKELSDAVSKLMKARSEN